jgi:hypothetical protein
MLQSNSNQEDGACCSKMAWKWPGSRPFPRYLTISQTLAAACLHGLTIKASRQAAGTGLRPISCFLPHALAPLSCTAGFAIGTQRPVRPGESFVYSFIADTPGTFWCALVPLH